LRRKKKRKKKKKRRRKRKRRKKKRRRKSKRNFQSLIPNYSTLLDNDLAKWISEPELFRFDVILL
jgi:transposase